MGKHGRRARASCHKCFHAIRIYLSRRERSTPSAGGVAVAPYIAVMPNSRKDSSEDIPLSADAIAPFFERGDSVLVGFSGGPDSAALLHLLYELSDSMDIAVTACYINHLIRPSEAAEEQRFCEDFCDRLEIPFVSATVDIPGFAKEQKKSLELAGREMRRHLLREIADDENCEWIALGHHADDQVETILFRIFRGTGPEGLLGIAVHRDDIIRPLLPFTRAEILTYLRQHKLTFITDSSNTNETHTRNFIRHRVIPLIEERFPAVRDAVLRLSEIIAEEWLQGQASLDDIFSRIATISPGGVLGIHIDKFNELELATRRQFIRAVLNDADEFDVGLDFAGVERVVDIAALGRGGLSLPNDVQATVERGELYFVQGPRIKIEPRPLISSGEVEIPELLARIRIRTLSRAPKVLKRQEKGRKAQINSAAVVGAPYVRSMRPADVFQPLGLKGTKKLGDFFTDRKVPVVLRGEIPLVCDQKGIIWVIGHEIADRVKITKSRAKVTKSGPIWEMEIRYDSEEQDRSGGHGTAQD